MLILSLSFFCSKLTSWMNPASIIIIILLTLNLMKGLDGHLWRELMGRSTTLWDRNGSLGREERVVETQAHRNTNEETLVESETPTKEGKKNEPETRPSSIDKEIVGQVTKRLAEDSAKRPGDPGQEARERIKEPAEICNNGQISSADKTVRSSQKERTKRLENSSASKQIRVLTESEKAQKSKTTNDQVKNQSSKSQDKGKERMAGERRRDDNTETSVKMKTEEKAAPKEPPFADPSKISAQSKIEEDALMSGDYRSLKPALKKPTKKPKQTQNIHHNYFMTMRGFRPALIPFPHGLHPKPHYPRNTMWWNNIPEIPRHIMAAPKVPKEPEEVVDAEEPKGKKKITEVKKPIEKKGEVKKDDGKDRVEKLTSESRWSEKTSAGKIKAEAEPKARKEAGIKASRTGAAPAPSNATINKDLGRASVSAKVSLEPMAQNHQLDKATYATQAMLCILLYRLYPQLSFLLLVFFVWQYIDSQQEFLPTLDETRATDRSTVTSSAAVSKSVSSRTTTSSTTDEKPAAETKPKVTEESSKDTLHSSSQKGPENENDSEKEKLAELESLIKKLKSENDLMPALKGQLRAALKTRDELIASLQRENSKGAEPPMNDANHIVTGEEIKKPTNEGAENDTTIIKGLMHKLKEVESYLKKHQAQHKVSSGSEQKLSKVKAQREVLKVKIANLQRRNMSVEKDKEPGVTTPASKDSDHRNDSRSLSKQPEGKPQSEKASIKEYSSKQTTSSEESNKSDSSITADNSNALSVECLKMKDKIKAIESYIMKYRKLDTLSDEQKQKVTKAEKQRKEMKEKFKGIVRKMANVGSSGLSIEEKETIAKET
ncbi:hypothetical protein AYX14_04321 [Cryptococcus neoformans]|nr:hypothetical protein AYX14_04321 [Cryptococcus neoformans var. grubii]